jgi:hypothetical protein
MGGINIDQLAKLRDVNVTGITDGQMLAWNTATSKFVAATPALAALTDVTLSSVARGDVLYRGATKWNNLPAGTAGQALLSGGAGADPSWGTIDLTGYVQKTGDTMTGGLLVDLAAAGYPLRLRGASGQSEDLQRWESHDGGSVLAKVDTLGNFWGAQYYSDLKHIISHNGSTYVLVGDTIGAAPHYGVQIHAADVAVARFDSTLNTSLVRHLFSHLGSAVNDVTQDAVRIQPSGALAANYRGIAQYASSGATTPVLWSDSLGQWRAASYYLANAGASAAHGVTSYSSYGILQYVNGTLTEALFAGAHAMAAGTILAWSPTSDPTGAQSPPAGSRIYMPLAPTATANYGLVSLGSGAWDGSTSGFFAGSASGTVIAVNAASGYAGNLIDAQVAGVQKFRVTKDGYLQGDNSGGEIRIGNTGGVIDFFSSGSHLIRMNTNGIQPGATGKDIATTGTPFRVLYSEKALFSFTGSSVDDDTQAGLFISPRASVGPYYQPIRYKRQSDGLVAFSVDVNGQARIGSTYGLGASVPTNWAARICGRTGIVSSNRTFYFDIPGSYAEFSTYDYGASAAFPMVFQANGGNVMIGSTTDNGHRLAVSGRVYSTTDLVSDSATKGAILKAPDGHYWRVLVDNTGALTTTDLGTSLPA